MQFLKKKLSDLLKSLRTRIKQKARGVESGGERGGGAGREYDKVNKKRSTHDTESDEDSDRKRGWG